MPPIPLILAAFGTATKAQASYAHLDHQVRSHFPGHEIFWAWSSRMIANKLGSKHNTPAANPNDILMQLHQRGEPWAVVQSLHMLGGYEFDRLVTETSRCPIRTSIGLPLLSSPLDYEEVCRALAPRIHAHPDQAILLIGHGTDHPAWCAYPAMENILRRHFGPRIFVSTIEGAPNRHDVIAQIKAGGGRQVCLIPLLLVAGMHFQRDLTGNHKDTWITHLQQAGIDVNIIDEGLISLPAIEAIFCRHIEDALMTIPENISDKMK